MIKKIAFTLSLSIISLGIGMAQLSDAQSKFVFIMDYIENFYVEDTDESELVEKAVNSMLQELDPHSNYISREEIQKMNEPLSGSFQGIGIHFNILSDTIYVVSPISGGPSEKVGMQAGDRIVKIEGENVAGIGITNTDVQRLLKGPKGTEVNVSVKRRRSEKLIAMKIIRDNIPLYSVDASYVIENQIGYVKINRFAQTTMEEFQKAVEGFKKQKLKGFILDLRGNNGGYLEVAFQLADEFLSKGRQIVYTEGIRSPKKEYLAGKKGRLEDVNLVVLIDEGSASASEIVSGAIQDWDRGMVIGRRSFGKGLVQKIYPLPDGSALKLTVSKYYTPTGRLIQKPYEEGEKAYHRDIYDRFKRNEQFSADSIQFPDSLKYKTLVKGRTVYGGGGIMPDIFLPMDTLHYSAYYGDLISAGLFNRFILNYTDSHREELKSKYPSFETYNAKFFVSDKIVKQLVEYGASNDVPFNKKQFEVSKEHMKMMMKARIAGDLWTESQLYEIVNQDNYMVSKAVEVLKDWDIQAGELK